MCVVASELTSKAPREMLETHFEKRYCRVSVSEWRVPSQEC
jgi:hypothetical protein